MSILGGRSNDRQGKGLNDVVGRVWRVIRRGDFSSVLAFFGRRSRDGFEHPGDDGGDVQHKFAIQVLIVPAVLHPQHLDPPARVHPLLPHLGSHLIEVISARGPGDGPLTSHPMREERQVVLEARVGPLEEWQMVSPWLRPKISRKPVREPSEQGLPELAQECPGWDGDGVVDGKAGGRFLGEIQHYLEVVRRVWFWSGNGDEQGTIR